MEEKKTRSQTNVNIVRTVCKCLQEKIWSIRENVILRGEQVLVYRE